jgi:hypothetical protein
VKPAVGLLRRRGFRQGVMGQSRGWLALWIALAGRDFLRKRMQRKAVVARYELKPGQSLLIEHLDVREAEAPSPTL